METKNILVTGGAGFIGSHLCDNLLEAGYKVFCLDNLITGSKGNIAHLLGNPNFEFIEKDISGSLVDLYDKNLNFIFHLASPASPIDYQNHPEETLLANSIGTLNALKLAEKTKARILVASTSEVYGDPKEHPQKETYFGNVNTFGPRSCYDESKRFAETASYVFLNKYGIDVRLVRIFNTYGPRMQKDDGRVVSNFIYSALLGKSLEIDGDGTQTRSFCYVSDLVDGIVGIMFADSAKGEIYNLGNPEEYQIKDLAEKILNHTGSKSEIKYSGKFRKDDPMRRQPDITKIAGIINWAPKVGVDEGLKRTIEYYKDLITKNN